MVVFTGNTVEEAIDKGLTDLGLSRTKASIRVLSRGKKGFFGFGKKPAEVEVETIHQTTVSQADQAIIRSLPQALSKQQTSEEALRQEKLESRKVTSIIKYLEKRGQIVNDEAKSEMLSARRSVTAILTDLLPDEIVEEYRRKKAELDQEGLDWEDELDQDQSPDQAVPAPAPQQSDSSESDSAIKAEADRDDSFEAFIASEFDQVEAKGKADIAEAAQALSSYLEAIIYEMDVEAELTTQHSSRQITIQIETPEAGRVIGYHGKVLKSLQILAQNYLHEHYSRSFSVTVNVHDYNERRMETLSDYAQKIAHKVLDSGQAYRMDSMTNDERKIIHKTIAKMAGVESFSEGEDPKRYVVVVPSS